MSLSSVSPNSLTHSKATETYKYHHLQIEFFLFTNKFLLKVKFFSIPVLSLAPLPASIIKSGNLGSLEKLFNRSKNDQFTVRTYTGRCFFIEATAFLIFSPLSFCWQNPNSLDSKKLLNRRF